MKSFKDNEGRSWTLSVTIDAVKRVRSLLEVDLLEVAEGKLLERLVTDPVLLCDVVYAVCKPEADEAGVSDEQFGRAMAGEAIDAAAEALLAEIVDFFPRDRRAVLGKALTKVQSLQSRASALVSERLDSPELEREIEALLSGSAGSSGGAPGSSGSTPAT